MQPLYSHVQLVSLIEQEAQSRNERVQPLHLPSHVAAYRFAAMPSTTLKVTGIGLTSMGEVNPKGDGFHELRHTDAAAGVYKKLVIRDGRVVGAIVLGDRSNVRAISQLIERKIDVSAHMGALLHEGFNLASLI